MTQLNQDDLAGMTPEQIVAAHDAGRLSVALGMTPDDAALIERGATGAVTPADLTELSRLGRHDLIDKAHTEGRLTFTTRESETPA